MEERGGNRGTKTLCQSAYFILVENECGYGSLQSRQGSPPRETSVSNRDRQGRAREHYQPAISLNRNERQLSFTDRFCSEFQRLTDITWLKIWISFQNFLDTHSIRHHSDNSCHRDSKSANAGNTSHLCRINGDEIKIHTHSLLPRQSLSHSDGHPMAGHHFLHSTTLFQYFLQIVLLPEIGVEQDSPIHPASGSSGGEFGHRCAPNRRGAAQWMPLTITRSTLGS